MQIPALPMPPTTILIVDDRPGQRLVLEELLRPLGQDVICASSGEEAGTLARHTEFSVILLDVRMPGMDGFETARLIRTTASAGHTPIIFVSASDDPQELTRAYELGAVDFITAPVNPLALRAKVLVFVDLYQMRKLVESRAEERRALERAEAESAAKDHFLAALSHELRTPLTPVLLAIEALENDANFAGERATLHMVRRNLQLEARLIDDLLDLARVREGKLSISQEVTSLKNAVQRAVEICQAAAAAKKIRLSLHVDATECHVRGDPARMQQIFWNLISNALKFTQDGGWISVQISNPSHGIVHAEVSDNGLGIKPENLSRVFERFTQIPSADGKRSPGLGLGLTITKSLVEAQSGTISVFSDGLGRGATFVVRFPIEESDVTVKADSGMLTCSADSPISILLVEDHKDTRDGVIRLLERKGFRILAAGTVAEAVRLGATAPFQLLLTDLDLPDGTGFDVLRELSGRRRDFRAVALSGFGMPSDIQKTNAAGFSQHLLKPVDAAKLVAVITSEAKLLSC